MGQPLAVGLLMVEAAMAARAVDMTPTMAPGVAGGLEEEEEEQEVVPAVLVTIGSLIRLQ